MMPTNIVVLGTTLLRNSYIYESYACITRTWYLCDTMLAGRPGGLVVPRTEY